ncbi:tyrosine-type recombinase/integrase [Patescibacteria group bacterium]|nr:tyrosine-type recombinase/integrase [Patescibacteria group bacterium]
MKKITSLELGFNSYPRKIFDNLDVSESTRVDYNYRIGLFLTFIKYNHFVSNSFLDFKRYLSKRNDYAVSTKNKYLITAKVFLKELNRLGFLPINITQNVKLFQQNRKHKRIGLSESEVLLLSEKIKQLPITMKNTRLRAILCCLVLQGLRQKEIIGLAVRDLDLVNQTISITGKGREDKEMVDLHPETVKALSEYLVTNKIADGPLFVSQSNHKRNNRLTTRGLRGIVKAMLKELNINKCVHGFRHYFATKLIKTYKGDLLAVAQYTRHKSIDTLQIYNDSIKHKEDLPRFYRAFQGIQF